MMHPVQVLLEVIEARPPLVRARAVCPETQVHHLGPTLGLFIVNAFLMTGKIVNGAKPVLPWAIRHVTFEELFVASLVFPSEISFLLSQFKWRYNRHTFYPKDISQPSCMMDARIALRHPQTGMASP